MRDRTDQARRPDHSRLPSCLCKGRVRPSASAPDHSPPPPRLAWASCRERARAIVYAAHSCGLRVPGVYTYSNVVSGPHCSAEPCQSHPSERWWFVWVGDVSHCCTVRVTAICKPTFFSCSIGICHGELIFWGKRKPKNAWLLCTTHTNSWGDTRSRWNFWLSWVLADLSVVRFHCARSISIKVVVGGEEMISALLWQIVLITEDVTVIEGFKQNKVCASWNKPICFSFFSPSQMNFPCEINNLVVSKAFLLKRTIVWGSTSCLSFSLRKIGQQVTPALAITCLFEGTVAWWIWRCTLICNTFQSWI